MTIGIYQIQNNIDGNCYVGSSKNIEGRFTDHFCVTPNRYKHGNKSLLDEMFRLGKSAFIATILEVCPEDKLKEREQYWIAKLKPRYNRIPGSGGGGNKGNSNGPEARRKNSMVHLRDNLSIETLAKRTLGLKRAWARGVYGPRSK